MGVYLDSVAAENGGKSGRRSTGCKGLTLFATWLRFCSHLHAYARPRRHTCGPKQVVSKCSSCKYSRCHESTLLTFLPTAGVAAVAAVLQGATMLLAYMPTYAMR